MSAKASRMSGQWQVSLCNRSVQSYIPHSLDEGSKALNIGYLGFAILSTGAILPSPFSRGDIGKASRWRMTSSLCMLWMSPAQMPF